MEGEKGKGRRNKERSKRVQSTEKSTEKREGEEESNYLAEIAMKI